MGSNESRERIQFICELVRRILVHEKLGFGFPIQSHSNSTTVERRPAAGLDVSIFSFDHA